MNFLMAFELTAKAMKQVINRLNIRHRKAVRFRTPNEVLYEHLVVLHLRVESKK